MTTITNSPVIGVTTATKYIEGVETHSFIINVQHLKEALAVAESLEFVDSDKHVKILSTNNPADGLLIQSEQYPKGSVRCACIEVVSDE